MINQSAMTIECEVTFQSGSLRLAETLMLPDREGRFPVVLLLPGSGPLDRNENAKIISINAKWMREFMKYTPAEDLERIQVPVLALTGTKDIQTDPADLDHMAHLIKGEFESHKVPDVTHMLRADPGQPTINSYSEQVKRPVDARLLELVCDWLHRHTHGSSSR